jgi:hypothetical protein
MNGEIFTPGLCDRVRAQSSRVPPMPPCKSGLDERLQRRSNRMCRCRERDGKLACGDRPRTDTLERAQDPQIDRASAERIRLPHVLEPPMLRHSGYPRQSG